MDEEERKGEARRCHGKERTPFDGKSLSDEELVDSENEVEDDESEERSQNALDDGKLYPLVSCEEQVPREKPCKKACGKGYVRERQDKRKRPPVDGPKEGKPEDRHKEGGEA